MSTNTLKNQILLACCAATAFLLLSCNAQNTGRDAAISTLARGLPGDPRSLDPSKGDDNFSQQVLRDLWEGLTNIDRNDRVEPGVATDWSVSLDGLTYVFHLRHDAKWSDGRSVVAQQFVDGFRHAVDPSTGSGTASLLTVIRNAAPIIAGEIPVAGLGVTALDAYTLQVDLERPAPFVLQILAEPICAPLRNENNSSASRVTEGPYTVADRRLGSYVRLAANPYYWNRSGVRLQTINYVVTDSESSELRQYLADQLDLTYTVPLPDLARLRIEHANELQSAPLLGTMYLALNLASADIGKSKELREALSIAIDRESIARNLTLGASPAFGFVAHGIENYSPFKYEWSNLQRDQQIDLAKSDYAKSGHSQTHPLRLTLYYNNNESIKRIVVAIADSWKRNLGIETDLLGEEFRVFLDGRKDRSKWDAARLGWWADYNDASSFLEIFTTTGIQNDPGYRNNEYDRLIGAARVEADENRRALLLGQAEAKLLDDYAIIPVYFYSAVRLAKPELEGSSISPMNRTYSRLLSWRSR